MSMSEIYYKESTGTPPTEPSDRGGPATPLLSVRGLVKHFGHKGGLLSKGSAIVRAVRRAYKSSVPVPARHLPGMDPQQRGARG